MTPADIKAVFPFAFVGGSNYARPTVAWLQGAFWDYFKGTLWDDDLQTWTVKWECRDFARAFACFAQVCNALTPDSPAGTDALAVGEFWFRPDSDTTKGHAICACFTEQGLIFIEPQNGTIVKLSECERSSVFFSRF